MGPVSEGSAQGGLVKKGVPCLFPLHPKRHCVMLTFPPGPRALSGVSVRKASLDSSGGGSTIPSIWAEQLPLQTSQPEEQRIKFKTHIQTSSPHPALCQCSAGDKMLPLFQIHFVRDQLLLLCLVPGDDISSQQLSSCVCLSGFSSLPAWCRERKKIRPHSEQF